MNPGLKARGLQLSLNRTPAYSGGSQDPQEAP
jgi:hypothetical protein